MKKNLFLLTLAMLTFAHAQAAVVQVLTTEGKIVEGESKLSSISVTVNGAPRKVLISQLLSLHSAQAATSTETAAIDTGLLKIAGTLRSDRDLAVEELTAIGIPVLTPLLKTFKDTDQHEPKPLYRLFDRIMPPGADMAKRDVSLLRLASGEVLRGEVAPFDMTIGTTALKSTGIRRLAVRRKVLQRRFELHSLRHCTQIEYLDSGVGLSTDSAVNVKSRGWVRMAWNEDGWASDPDGLKVPGSPAYKTNLVDGFPFGAMVGRIGASGPVMLIGSTLSAKKGSAGRFYLAVNDNRHWQNNVGAYSVNLDATDAYDLGDAQ